MNENQKGPTNEKLKIEIHEVPDLATHEIMNTAPPGLAREKRIDQER